MITDDDIRTMLRTKAEEATVSADAWDRIAARLGEADTAAPVRHLTRRLAAAGLVAAAVAGTVLVANLPQTSQVAHTTTTTTHEVSAIEPVVTAWLHERFPADVDAGIPDVEVHGDDARVTFRRADLATELFLRMQDTEWRVVSAASDLVLVDNPTYDGHELVASVTPESDGQLTTTYVVDGRVVDGGTRPVTRTEAQPLGYPVEGARSVSVRVVLRTDDGTVAVAEQPAQVRRDPATVAGSYVAVGPATDSVGLATLQRDADAGRRPDLFDARAVAGGFLSELLPRGETPTSFAVGDFQRGDPTSGEVPYTLDGKAAGTIFLRRTGDDKTIWFVSRATSDVLEVVQTRREGTDLVVDVRSTRDGTLTWTGATPVAVKAGQTVSIGRQGTPAIGSYPVVVRLVQGTRTLAVVAQLG